MRQGGNHLKRSRITIIVGAIAVVAVLVFALMPRSGTEESKSIAIDDFSAQALPDRLSLALVLKDSTNHEVAVPGTISYVISGDDGNQVYAEDRNVSSSEYQPVNMSGTQREGFSWDVNYASLSNIAPTNNLTVTVTFKSTLGADTKSNSMALPPSLKHLSPLYYEEGEPKEFASMFDKGEVSAAIVYEPYVSELIADGYGKAWLWSKDIWPGHPYYVLTFDRQWAEANPDLAKRMIKVNEVATEWINHAKENNQSQEYSQLIQTAKGVLNWDDSILRSAIDNIQYKSGMSDQALNYFKNYTDGYIAEGLLQKSMLTTLGYSNSSELVDSEVNTTRVSEAQEVKESSTILGTVRLGFVSSNIHQMARAVAMNASLWGGKTLYERYGIDLVAPQPNGYSSSGSVMGIGFGNKQIDAGYLGSCSTILDRMFYGINAFIACEVSSEGTALIVNSSIGGLSDLSGKAVATPGPNTIQHLMLIDLANREWFTLEQKARA